MANTKLKSFIEHCDSFNCSFSQKETKFHTWPSMCVSYCVLR